MMRKLILAFCLTVSVISITTELRAQKGKVEIGLAYGYWSFYTLYNDRPYNVSTGTPNFNLRYYLNDNTTIGLGIGYENNCNWGSFLSFCPEMTFKYLDTKDDRIRIRLYGAAAFGFVVFDDWINSGPDNTDNTGLKLWGFQFTPFGIRVGRKFSCFAEVGLGYKGLVNTGLSYRFKAVKKGHHPAENQQ